MWEYKPCRVMGCYKNVNELITIATFGGTIELSEASSIVWMHCDGKHTIQDIIYILYEKYKINKDSLFNEVCKVIGSLVDNGVLVPNWDPILKKEANMEECI